MTPSDRAARLTAAEWTLLKPGSRRWVDPLNPEHSFDDTEADRVQTDRERFAAALVRELHYTLGLANERADNWERNCAACAEIADDLAEIWTGHDGKAAARLVARRIRVRGA